MTNPIHFSKYQSTGNDFILIDNRQNQLHFSRTEIARLCHRKFGIGADGLILLHAHPQFDFEMKNYNADGGECSMCGNGGRALIQFALDLGLKKSHFIFQAIDGVHEARIVGSQIELKMQNVTQITETSVGPALNTGSPHLVIEVKHLVNHEVVKEGRALRNSPIFMPGGINVNFYEQNGGNIFLRTYERGVEDETLSCGTGAIATAIITAKARGLVLNENIEIPIHCQGGDLKIRFKPVSSQEFDDIWLIGPSVKTFEGVI